MGNHLMRNGLTASAGIVLLLAAHGAFAQMSWLTEFGVDPAEYQCLSTAIYNGNGPAGEAVSDEDMIRIAWVLNNRRASADFPATYCELLATDATPSPWDSANGRELVRAVMRADFNTPAYEKAKLALESFRASVEIYRSAQKAAYRLMAGWFDEDPTGGATALEVETVTETS